MTSDNLKTCLFYAELEAIIQGHEFSSLAAHRIAAGWAAWAEAGTVN